MSVPPPLTSATTPFVPDDESGPHPRAAVPHRVLGFLAVLYVGQFIGLGFLNAAATVLRSRGVALEDLAVLQAVGIVWGIKFLWGPLVDRVGFGRLGHYRGWLILMQSAMVLSLLGLMAITSPETTISLVAALVLAFSVAASTQDIAADALAARLLRAGRRGLANGIQQAGGYLGTLIGGGLTVLVYDAFGWSTALGFVAALTAIPLVVAICFREPAAEVSTGRSSYGSLLTLVRQPGAALWMFVAMPLLFVGATSLAYALVGPALIDAGARPGQVALTTTVFAAIPAILVSLATGWAIGVFGRIRVAAVGIVLVSIALLTLMPLFASGTSSLWSFIAYGTYAALQTIIGTVIYTVSMDYSRAASAGSDVTFSMAPATVLSMAAAAGGLYAAASVGYATVAWVAIAMTVAGGALVLVHLHRYEPYLIAQANRAAIAAS